MDHDQTPAQYRFDRFANAVFGLFGYLLIIAAALIFSRDGLHWLQTGLWEPLRFFDLWFAVGFEIPQPTWVGVRQILYWFFNCYLSVIVLLVGTATVGIADEM